MNEKVSLEETNRRWEVLLSRKRQSDELVRPSVVLGGDTDPFDCADCVVPTTYALVEDVLSQAVNEWRDLDDRKIPEEQVDAQVAKKPKWYNMHVRLPHGFDYATQKDQPPADDGGGDRLIQLDDPSQTASYHQELWRLFQSVPTRSTLEEEAMEGFHSPALTTLRQEWQGKKQLQDEFGVCSLRMNDRHGGPETGFGPPTAKTKGTLVFEIWRGMIPHLPRTSSPCDDRLVLEFLGEQTLEDFHRVLVELSGDDFWQESVQTTNEEKSKRPSGMFVMEDTIYTIGDVDYSDQIMEWLKGDEKRAKNILGVELKDISVQRMDTVHLEQISMRLGIRYFHVHSGSMKSQVFLVDRRHGYPRQPTIARNYPVIIDMWSSAWPAPECEACRRCCAVIVTSLECDLSDGHKALCQNCADALHVPAKYRQPYHVWKMCGTSGPASR